MINKMRLANFKGDQIGNNRRRVLKRNFAYFRVVLKTGGKSTIVADSASSDVIIYIDGACHGNPGPGGWGALLIWKTRRRELFGGEADATNNRMELTAAIKALEALRRPVRAVIHTDSSYLVNGITRWLPDWVRRGWRTADKKPVLNRDLWERVLELTRKHHVTWRWLRGHSGDAGNERAHELATIAAEKVQEVPKFGKFQSS